MALAVAISRCSLKLSLRSNCTPRYLMLFFHSISCSPRAIFGYWKDLLSVTGRASVFSGSIFRSLLSNQSFARHRVSLILSRQVHAQEIVLHDVPNERTHPRPLRGATCHLFLERPFVALTYHPPVAQIVIYHSQQVVWNLFLHDCLDADFILVYTMRHPLEACCPSSRCGN